MAADRVDGSDDLLAHLANACKVAHNHPEPLALNPKWINRDMNMELRRRVWDARIALAFEFSGQVFYVMAPRVAYLALVAPGHLQAAAFRCNGVSLPGHWPVGLLYDLHGGALPWCIEIVTDSAPLPNIASIFYSAVKQADFIRNSSGRGIQRLTKSQQEALWDAYCSRDYLRFAEVERLLLECDWRAVPLKIYDGDSTIQRLYSTQTLVGDIVGGRNAVIHGVPIMPDATLSNLLELSYPDGFLHIVAKD
ncbi:MAG: hypothetical protein JW384_01653 [Nitrosomonadaceae bacterium]|nr:hypothetical protein [Nitrosomonadaceae bacterium]